MTGARFTVRVGRVRRNDADGCWVEFDDSRCAGCAGACGLTRKRPGLVRLDDDGTAAVGSRVAVGVPAAGLAGVVWMLLGLPVLALIAVPAVHRAFDPGAGDGLLALSGLAACAVALLVGARRTAIREACGTEDWRPRILGGVQGRESAP